MTKVTGLTVASVSLVLWLLSLLVSAQGSPYVPSSIENAWVQVDWYDPQALNIRLVNGQTFYLARKGLQITVRLPSGVTKTYTGEQLWQAVQK